MKPIHTSIWSIWPIWLIACFLIFWPVQGWAAPWLQGGGTIPAPAPTESPVLIVRLIYTIPETVVINEPFDLVVNVQNTSPMPIDSLVVTYRDVADDQALIALNGSKTETVRAPGPLQGIEFGKGFRYLLFFPNRREIEVRLDYTYTVAGQTIANTLTTSIILLVAAPTPTPTVTWTPTPTFTPTPIPTATPTPMLVTPPAPQPPIVIVITPSAPPQPESAPQPENAPQPGATPTETFQESSVGGGSGSSARPAVVVEFDHVPVIVRPGEIFSMTLVVRNITTATVTAVTATWNTFGKPIIPVGSGITWYLNNIRPGDKQTAAGRFYVDEGTPNGIQTLEVTVEYHDAPRPAIGIVNLLVQALPAGSTPTPAASAPSTAPVEEPSWLRFLRSLFGAPPP